LNILAACGVVELERSNVTILKLLLMPCLVQANSREDEAKVSQRLTAVENAWPADAAAVEAEDLSILRELFGANFLTPQYHLTTLDIHKS
jgi:hypothetical protein